MPCASDPLVHCHRCDVVVLPKRRAWITPMFGVRGWSVVAPAGQSRQRGSLAGLINHPIVNFVSPPRAPQNIASNRALAAKLPTNTQEIRLP